MTANFTNWNLHLAEALHDGGRGFHRALKRCRKDFSTRAVHECRVEARRLLSSIDLIQSIAPQKGFRKGRRAIRKCLKLLQPLRDVQVQLGLARQSSIASVPLIRSELSERRRHHRRKAIEGLDALSDARTRRLAGKIERWLRRYDNPVDDQRRIRRVLAVRLTAGYKKVIGLRATVDPGDVETIHRVRIAFKKFRYTIEPVRGLLTDFPAETMRDFKSLQDALGSLQDTDVFLQRLDKWIRKQPELARPLALFRHWLLCLRPQQIHTAIEWMDRLPAEWQGGSLHFMPGKPNASSNGAPRPAESDAATPRRSRDGGRASKAGRARRQTQGSSEAPSPGRPRHAE